MLGLGVEVLAVLAGFALLGLFVLDLTLERQDVPWIFVCAIALAREMSDPLPAINAAGIAINGEDIILAVALLVVTGWLFRGMALQTPQTLMALAVLLVMMSVLRGAPEFGLPAAINEARETLYFLGAGLLGSFAPVGPKDRRRLMNGWLVLCGGLAALAILRWGIVFSGLPFRGHWYESEFAGLRVLDSNGALVLTIGFLMLLPRLLRGRATRLEQLAGGCFGVVVVLLQHRSVWLTLVAGTAYLVWDNRKRVSRTMVMSVGVGVVVFGLVSLLLVDFAALGEQAGRADATSDKTWQWRVSGWADLLEESGPVGPFEYLFGVPYGSGWERSVSAGFDVDVPPHNFYLEMLLRIGLVGILLVVAAGWMSARRLRHHELEVDDGYLNASVMLTILTIQALYSVPYNLGMEQGLLFGLAMAIWADPQRRMGRGLHLVRPGDSLVRR
ncbi:O-antigen ligase family protein [Euzebya rosea]|uniref:O-antigen ligase family protein n=1 Tax=Euzebya rosea TaxID=2052804 RepID=UPI000D3E5749|nr:O-antigen ligase family protein [Euzebya rosea]